ncbi:hypothetical protein FB45DRAFT_732613, partial [Roridomyces roridus]
RRVDMGRATEEDLVSLNAACQKATFGVGGKDVLDESYRKAAKMDANNFSLRFEVTALLAAISPELLQGQNGDNSKFLRVEMYKLNHFFSGPGSFFKAHQDTPRGEDMIGSLVLVFPTAHQGGALTLEHDGQNWAFDSAADIAAATQTPTLAYVAFYSDVAHAVQTVHTGYRVTLTYNLYLSDRHATAADIKRQVPEHEKAFELTLRALLADTTFLPEGGLLGYSLAHQYPIPSPPARLPHLLPLLKGSDAHIRTISERVGLTTHVKVLYSVEDDGWPQDVLADDVLNTENIDQRNMYLDDEIIKMGVRLKSENSRYTWRDAVAVHWVTERNELNRVRSTYKAYGNEPSVGHMYGNAALFVDIPETGRGARAQVDGQIQRS